jgi:hypothetical protein
MADFARRDGSMQASMAFRIELILLEHRIGRQISKPQLGSQRSHLEHRIANEESEIGGEMDA